jgi:hypothetical protein
MRRALLEPSGGEPPADHRALGGIGVSRYLGRIGVLAVSALLAFPLTALASSVDESIVDVTAPTGSVTLAPGGSAVITINMTVTGNQVGTATFDVYRDWTVSGGAFAGSNPQTFTVPPRAAQDPATKFSTSGTVTVAAGQEDGTFTLVAGAFNITNSNQTGAKLAIGDPTNYQIAVQTPTPSDTTPPVIGYTLDPAAPDGDNGWYTSDVTLTWTVSEPDSPASLVKTGCSDQSITADQVATTYSCSATSDGGSAGPVTVTIKRDATPPGASASAAPAPNGNDWNNTNVTVSFSGTDALSGIANCSADVVLSAEGTGKSASGTCTDNAGNESAVATASGINIDKTAPDVSLVGGPAEGASYYYSFVPAAPTCSASDALSGVASCEVGGYGTSVGSHTVTATATDNADNQASASATYSVLAWSLTGFYQPVDMNGVVNTIKGGSTVPLKFNVFAGRELTSTSVVKSFSTAVVQCSGLSSMSDEVEVTTTGGTSLRYDATGGQFVQNWQTPKTSGSCYRATLTTLDGSALVAFFRTK